MATVRKPLISIRRSAGKAVMAALFGALLLSTPPAWAADGTLKSVSGTAFILRGGEKISAEAGMPVNASDEIETGSDGKLGITLKDNTRISFGPNSRFALEEYAFDPQQDNMSLSGRIAFGTMSFVSGQLGKLAPEKVKLDSPMGSIGLRGTSILVKIPKP